MANVFRFFKWSFKRGVADIGGFFKYPLGEGWPTFSDFLNGLLGEGQLTFFAMQATTRDTLCCLSDSQGLKCQKAIYYYMNLGIFYTTNASCNLLCVLEASHWGFFNVFDGL